MSGAPSPRHGNALHGGRERPTSWPAAPRPAMDATFLVFYFYHISRVTGLRLNGVEVEVERRTGDKMDKMLKNHPSTKHCDKGKRIQSEDKKQSDNTSVPPTCTHTCPILSEIFKYNLD